MTVECGWSKKFSDLEVCISGVDTVEATINDTEIYEQVYPGRYKYNELKNWSNNVKHNWLKWRPDWQI